jgi:G3E family GTPase
MLRPPEKLPVTLVSGFVGAGKTSLVKHLLAHCAGLRPPVLRPALIVNDAIVRDRGELDAIPRVQLQELQPHATPASELPAQEHLIAMSQGCICCSLRDELLASVRQLAAEGQCDYLLIEASGVTEPQPVAEAFTFEDEHGEGLSDVARLDTLVSVVDAESFLADWQSEDELSTRQLALDADDPRSVSDLLVAQIEFANVLVLSKVDRVSVDEAERIEALLAQLNPSARILRASHGELPVEAVVNTGLFDFEAAEQAPGWIAALQGEPAPADDEHGLNSFVYRARVPFHPERFWALLGAADTWTGVLRSKGFFWLASRMDVSGLWSHAGGSAMCEGTGPWYAALPDSEWPDDPEQREQILDDWLEPWGDRRQELVFIGVDLDEAALRAKLDAALLRERELAEGPDSWAELVDPFPAWAGHEPA